jgi:hypothetical protein
MIASLGMIVLNYLRWTELVVLFYLIFHIVLGDMQNCGFEMIYSESGGLSNYSGSDSSSGSNSEIRPCKKYEFKDSTVPVHIQYMQGYGSGSALIWVGRIRIWIRIQESKNYPQKRKAHKSQEMFSFES